MKTTFLQQPQESTFTVKFLAPTLAALALTFGAALPQAQAAVVTYHYTAAGIGGTATAGASVIGSFGFDITTADSDADANSGDYLAAGFLTAWVSGGVQHGTALSLTGLRWQVSDAQPGSLNSDALTVLQSTSSIALEDYSATAFASDALPTSLALADFGDMRKLRIAATGGQLDYTLTALWREPRGHSVPEPGTGLLLAAAGLGLVAVQRRRPQPRQPGQASSRSGAR